MTEQQEAPFPNPEDVGELLAGTPPLTGAPPPPTPEEMGSSKFPPEAPGVAPPAPAPEAEQSDGPQEFTMAEIQAAAEEMKKLPPQTFLRMKKRLETGDKVSLGEAGGIAWTTLYSESGAEFSVTERNVNATLAIDGLVGALMHAANKYNLSPLPKSSNGGGTTQVTNVTAGIETGTGDLNWISVDRNENDPSKIVVKFSVGKFKYPFQEHRGAAKALSLFDSALCEPRVQGGWSEGHFNTPGQRYEINGTLKVDWEHRGKYYNVLLVHS